MLSVLKQWGQLVEVYAVAALDEDVMVAYVVVGECLLDLLHIGKLAIRGVGMGKLFAHEPYILESERGYVVCYALVLLVGGGSQFAHVAEDGHLVVYQHEGEIVYRRLHAGGVGVVGIHDERVALGHGELGAVVARDVVLESMAYLLGAHAETESDGDGCQHVGDIVCAYEVGLHAVGGAVGPLEAEERGAANHPSHYVGMACGVGRVGHGVVEMALGGHGGEVGVGGVDEGLAVVGSEVVVEFALGGHHALERAEALQVGSAHIGNHAAGGLDILDQRADVAGMGCAHLHYSYLVGVVESQQRLGHSHIVVEVALGVHHAVALGEHSRYELLGSGLAVGACDAYHGDVELAAVLACQLLEGGQTVVDQDVSAVVLIVFLVVYHHIGTALVEGGVGEKVAVERGAPERDEDASLRTVAAVGGYSGVLLVQLV